MPRDSRIPGRQESQARRAARGRKPVSGSETAGGPGLVASRPRSGPLGESRKPGNRLAEMPPKRYISPIAAYRGRCPVNQ